MYCYYIIIVALVVEVEKMKNLDYSTMVTTYLQIRNIDVV